MSASRLGSSVDRSDASSGMSPAAQLRRTWVFVTGVLRAHAGLLAVAAAFTLASLILAARTDWRTAAPLLDWPSLFILPSLLLGLIPLVVVGIRSRQRIPWTQAWHAARQGPLSWDRLASIGLVLVVVRFTLLNAVTWKAAIPGFGPFRFDVPLADLDRALHGIDPWTALLPLVKSSTVIMAIDYFYAGWFLAFAAFIFWWGWAPWSGRRTRVLISLVSVWAIGSFAASSVSSAGPVYYGAVTGDAIRFHAPYQAFLATPTLAGELQSRLWLAYLGGEGGWIKGIAAFPSIHVAMPALYAVSSLGLWRLFWWGFTALTILGSVALGWHYVVDGYAAVIGTLIIWWLVKRVTGSLSLDRRSVRVD